MRVVVSGASGFIGEHLVAALRAAGARVIALSQGRPVPAADEHCACDVLSDQARALAASGEAVIHLAGLSDASLSGREPLLYGRVNALGTLNLLEGARERGAIFILASSQRVYQPSARPLKEDAPKGPAEPYGYSKLAAEQWLEMYRHLYALPAVTLRFFSVYGPGQATPGGTSGVAAIFLNRALAGEELWVDGDKKADLTYVGDVTRGIVLALDKGPTCGPVYNLATGVGTPLLELARLAKALTGSASPITVRSGSGPRGNLVADISRARAELGYAPQVGLREGLERTLEWLRSDRAHSA
ncbi:MAG: NAD-dependent epimerase/dehydratase family protein [Chloroflexi bacterium]|nr:NAD-dependent epimerase/dehydratase family protein [Chloroflexota bacterium]